jgi:Uma2 family endonuclease
MPAVISDRPSTDLEPSPYVPENFEFVDGELVERDMSLLSVSTGGELYHRLHRFAVEHKLGRAFTDGLGYRCFADDPRKVRRPDVSFIKQSRLTRTVVTSNEVTIPPDLVAEVVSPNDLFYEIEARVKEYLVAGVRLIWVINPDSGIVQVYRADGSWTRLTPEDDLSGEDVVEGFSCRIADLFLEIPAE